MEEYRVTPDYIYINHEKINNGDYFFAKISKGGYQDTVVGRVRIKSYQEDSYYYQMHLCQDKFDGEPILERFDYPFSWVVSVDKDTHELVSGDVSHFRKATYFDVIEHLKTNNYYKAKDGVVVETPVYSEKNEHFVDDDDPMPEDWEHEDILEL